MFIVHHLNHGIVILVVFNNNAGNGKNIIVVVAALAGRLVGDGLLLGGAGSATSTLPIPGTRMWQEAAAAEAELAHLAHLGRATWGPNVGGGGGSGERCLAYPGGGLLVLQKKNEEAHEQEATLLHFLPKFPHICACVVGSACGYVCVRRVIFML